MTNLQRNVSVLWATCIVDHGVRMNNMNNAVSNLLQSSVRSLFINGTPEENSKDVQTFAELCVSILRPIGTENLRETMSKFSDTALQQIVLNRKQLATNPLMNPVCQMGAVEWAYRQTHLDGDWMWQWDGKQEGHLTYKLKEPLTQIPLP